MIRLHLQAEPADFQTTVRDPGNAFLVKNGLGANDIVPENFPWESGSYWRRSYQQLYDAYDGICAYLGKRFYRTDMGTDHFLPKKQHPSLAYEWSNYRLCYRALNSSKGWRKPWCDPATVEDDWFEINLWTGEIVLSDVTRNLPDETKKLLRNTLEKLNEQEYRLMRLEFIDEWVAGKIDLELIERWFPFVFKTITRP